MRTTFRVFVRQANIAHGPQQVNNGARSVDVPRADEKTNRPNELLERRDDQHLDYGAAESSISVIHRWKPWSRSTGPRTPEGKARASRNADTGGTRRRLSQLARALREQERG